MAKEANTIPRPPVVAIMGHVDHGKSTLLDYIRKENTVDAEAGGITQHVSAYEVTQKDKDRRRITFVDTPGHAAFLDMRKRGAGIADIIVLVVSADDGVKPQTIESIKIILESKVPFIVAINKIDRPGADVDKVKQGLAENNVYVEGYGGDVPCIDISAKEGAGIPDLLDLILLSADLEEFKGNPNTEATGIVLESHIDPKIGRSATLIIKNGTMNIGDFVVVGGTESKVRTILDHNKKQMDSATFSTPVLLSGLSTLPKTGDEFVSFKDKKKAEKYAKEHAQFVEEEIIEKGDPDEDFVPVVVKADVAGTLLALEQEILKLTNETTRIRIIHKGLGDISENDVKAAAGAKSPVFVGFNVKIDRTAQDALNRSEIHPILFDVIYKVEEMVAPEIERRRTKVLTEEVSGIAKVIRIFGKTKKTQTVGASIGEGQMTQNASVKILRNDETICEGRIKEIQVNKKKVKTAPKGVNMGATIECSEEIKMGDIISLFHMVEK